MKNISNMKKRPIGRETRNCFFFAVENRSVNWLLTIIVEHIASGSLTISGQWASYGGIAYATPTEIINTKL